MYAFDHLHERHVLYRDLKPENLLIDEHGMCKLTDMGLAKVVWSKTYTTCGTSEYFAPEVIQQTGSGKAVDWWTLGILIHEFLSAHTPFESSSSLETYRKIVKGLATVNFPYKTRDPEAYLIVTALLKFNPYERLPMLPGGSDNIRKHVWYEDFDWKWLESGNFTPPYKPALAGPTDISNFKATLKNIEETPYAEVDPGTNWDVEFGDVRNSLPRIQDQSKAASSKKN